MIHLAAQYFLNHRLDVDEIEWQTRALAQAGYEAVYAHARQGLLTPFMSQAWWDAVQRMLDVCRETGMQLWIWDEDYYPSGTAGERIVWANPGLYARSLDLFVKEVSGAGPFDIDFAAGHCLGVYALRRRPDGSLAHGIDITAFSGTRRQHWTKRQRAHRAYSPDINPVGPPHWRCSMIDNQVAVSWSPEEPGDYVLVAALVTTKVTRHPDILSPESTRAFLDLCYEPYQDRFAAHLGDSIGGAFTDEPSPGGMLYPWTSTFPDAFREDHGYDLLPLLPHLAVDIDDRSAAVRLHYRQTQHRLQKAAYTDQIAAWCRAHHIISTGHLTRTEWLSYVAAAWPNELRVYQSMDIPCADPLGAAAAWPDAAAYHTGLKVASSAAHLFGKQQAGSDCLAVMGDETSLRDLKFILDYQMAMGITFFTVHGLSYSLDGPRKDEVPPSLFYQHSEWKHMHCLLDYTRQTAAQLCRGVHDCRIALLYPSTSLACQLLPTLDWRHLPDETVIHNLVECLLSRQKDLDFIDEVTLDEHTTAEGDLTTPESYEVILLPYVRHISAAAAAALNRLARSGRRVVAIGTMPRALPAGEAACSADWADAAVEYVAAPDMAFWASLPGPAVVGDGARDIFINRRLTDSGPLTLLFNRAPQAFDGTLDGRGVWLPPRGAVLLGDRQSVAHPLAGATAAGEQLHTGWSIDFESNHLPLAFWHAQAADSAASPSFSSPAFNLLERDPDPLPPGDFPACYHCRFHLSGPVPDMRLVLEDSAVGGRVHVRVNGQLTGPLQRSRVYDCRSLETPIGHLLRHGTSPLLNSITIACEGPGRGLREMPYLYGSFACEFPHGHPSLPSVRGEAPGAHSLPALQPWSVLGRPTFSGSAVYRNTLHLDVAGHWLLDLGRVEDVAAVRIADREADVLAWPPYVCDLGRLAAGSHPIAIEVTNGPANRNRLSGLASGLLGPVTLYRLSTPPG